MFKEIKGTNGRPEPSRDARRSPWWWGKVSVGGKSYAKFIATMPKGFGEKKASRTPIRVNVKEAHVYKSSGGSAWLDEYTDREDLTVWAFRGRLYEADRSLASEDVMALALESENKMRLKLEKAHSLMAMTRQLDERARRQPIPQDVKVLVWQRDSGRCVECGSQQELEYDHIVPLAMGGSNTDRNLQLLCAVCNRRKGASLG